MKIRLASLALVLSCGVAWGASLPHFVSGPTVAEQYLLSAANIERVQRGLHPLRWDRALYDAASYHAQQMVERESIAHQYSGEPELMSRGQQAGAHFSLIAENVAEAPTALMIQDAWMNSQKHRDNLLDPRVNSVGIRVIENGNRLYAVEDFDRSVESLTLAEQEGAVQQLLQLKSSLAILPTTDDARRTCSMETGYAGQRRPWFVMRYTASDLTSIPATLEEQMASGNYRSAVVGACPAQGTQSFSAYSIAVMLYR